MSQDQVFAQGGSFWSTFLSGGDPTGKATLSTHGNEYFYGLIVAATVSVFIVDLLTPLGVSEWVFYCIPIALSFLLWHPLIPPVLAAVITGLALLGFAGSPDGGAEASLAIQNRTFGTLTFWILAATGYLFIHNKLAMRRQEWLHASQAGLASRIAGDLTVTQVGDQVLRYFAEYLHANAGAFFVENGPVFERSASYGVPAKASVPEAIKPGDGLLGEAVKDGRTRRIDTVPEGYLYFGTSLGQSVPRQLVISPLKAGANINAVMELGFDDDDSELHSELLNRVSQTIGIAVRSARYRSRLQELLEETRRQAEEVSKQSEELRAANAELEQQSRALTASQERLELQQTELEQNNKALEDQTRSLEAQRADLERSQSTLRSQARELEQASRYKTEFLANMSHELRTPLNSALIMARLLADNRDGNLTAEQVRYAETIEASGNDLLTLINDILDLSKIEAGRVEVHPEAVSIARLVDKLTRTFEPMASQRKLSLRTEIDGDVPDEIETDPQCLEQILKNFASNAVKFTEQGEVVLTVRRAADGHLQFAVADTGIGIAPEQHDVIFEAFRQADGTTNRKYGGTGLGLSISRQLARILGGEIALTSEVGKGSEFSVTLPEHYDPALVRSRPDSEIAAAQAKPVDRSASQVRAPVARQVRTPSARTQTVADDRDTLSGDTRVILVVEDDAKFSRILYDLAHEQGFQCLIAPTADEGVTMARQFMPHAVILDIGLPDHSGLSVLDRLKHNVATRHIPVHVVSMHDYTQTAMSLGAVGYMLKPVKREMLVRALKTLEERLNRKVRRVLVVEDDANQLESIKALLASGDIEATGARTAAQSLEHLSTTTFDCMVLDLSLPDVSGFELLEELSKNEDRAFPPVIVYTGRELSADEELRLRRYSKSIIIKGAKSPERLLDEVTLFLHQVVSELPSEQQKILAQAVNRDGVLEGKRILVVEDDVRNVFALTSIFEPQGAIVEIARNGREALDALERAEAEHTSVDLVLMDVMMPEMDGLTATRKIREREAWAKLPIIVLTAKAMQNDQHECLSAGANDYMAKPLDVEKLLSLARVWVPK
jgi:signal transduction histidine kinase/DNA-binding response OmpR family regulator